MYIHTNKRKYGTQLNHRVRLTYSEQYGPSQARANAASYNHIVESGHVAISELHLGTYMHILQWFIY